MPTLTIDGRTVTAREGAYVLEAARQAGVDIPTLCHHEAVEPWGGCRLCLVDVTRPEWGGWWRMVAACLYPAEEGLVVHTSTERVLETRKVVLDLLLARCPDTPLVRDLAARHGIAATSYPRNPEPTDCILCGLCTRVCDVVGASAISAVNRGIGREIAPPFHDAPPACIGCLSCAMVCPTRCIPFEENDGTRVIWKKSFEMLSCPSCGRSHVTRAQAEFHAGRNGVPSAWMETCDACKRKDVAAKAAELGK
jgi:NADH dehydrogenase/NADH:ubiquinone oxidoreductase subunit G